MVQFSSGITAVPVTSPLADVSTVEARRAAYSMRLNKGLIRVGIGLPAGAEFTVEAIEDPYGYAHPGELSLFRRPLPSTNVSMTLFDGWAKERGSAESARRKSAVRGQALFNFRQFPITGVSGLNDELGAPLIMGTCSTCHNTPNVGNHSMPRALDIGLTDASVRTPDMRLYTLRNITTGELKQTTDPVKALISGKWNDVGRFKGAVLRGLAARAPYFHNGMAKTLEDVVDFCDTRFTIGLTAQEKTDLVAFMRAL